MVTECGMTQKLREDVPNKEFYSFCNFCPYMKVTDLQSVLEALEQNKHQIEIPESIRLQAKTSVDRMLQMV